MQVTVKGRHTHVSDPVKEMATRKLERIRRFFDRILTLEIEFSEEHNPRIADRHTVEVTLSTKQHVLRAHASGPDPASAVDGVVDKLERQVKSLKGKITRKGHREQETIRAPETLRSPSSRGSRRTGPATGPKRAAKAPRPDALVEGARNTQDVPIESSEGTEEDGADEPRITRVKRFALKPMTPEEAVLRMGSLGHDFYLFLDAESEQAGVVYRRKDGSFGLIEPE